MAILVVGGAGYIGSHTVMELLELGKDIVVYDNLSYGHKQAIKDVGLIIGDLSDKTKLGKTIRDYKVDSVIHFASYIQVGESMSHPAEYYRNKVCNT